jgi:pre-mRNA-splicing factor ATP-dependent RNA helicase DHX16
VRPMIIAPIYSTLPSELQAKIFEPTPEGARKVVLATNIAETSLTIDGIKFVIDSGLEKQLLFNPATGSSSLQTCPISRASAEQRAGRAGRVGPGTCLRLYTKYSYYSELVAEPQPELLRSDITSVVLALKVMGIDNIIDFDFLDSPSPQSLISGLEILYGLSALNSEGKLTRVGRKMAEIPTHPRLARSLIASEQYGCVQEVLTIVSMLDEAASLFYRPKEQKILADSARSRFQGEGGDHLALMRVYDAWKDTDYSITWCKENFVQYRSLQRARLVREQLEALCDRVEIPPDLSVGPNDHVSILKAILSGFFANTATLMRDGQHYRTAKSNMQVRIHPSSFLGQVETRPKNVMFSELVVTGSDWVRGVAPIEAEWLSEVAPHFWKQSEVDKLAGSKKKMPKGARN